MKDHFSYLLDDDANEFFRKVAIDESGVRATQKPVAMTKQASARVTPFLKLAGRLDKDMAYLALSSDCGLQAGMLKRADAYMQVVASQADLSPHEVGEIFDKVAAKAIEVDLAAAQAQLCDQFPDAQAIVDDVLIKIGAELFGAALEEKASLLKKLAVSLPHIPPIPSSALAALKGGSRAIEGAKAVASAEHSAIGAEKALESAKATRARIDATPAAKGPSIGALGEARARARGLASGIAQPFRAAGKAIGNTIQGAAAKAQKWHQGKIEAAPEKIREAIKHEKSLGDVAGGSGAYSAGKQKSYENQLAGAEAKREAQRSKLSGKPPAEAGAAKTQAAEGARQEGAAGAAQAAKAPESKPAASSPPKEGKVTAISDHPNFKGTGTDGPAPKPAGEHTPPPPGGAEGKPPGFMDAWKKATTHGWKGLSAEERGSLIRGGVTAALVYRAATGKGAVTGGEGVI